MSPLQGPARDRHRVVPNRRDGRGRRRLETDHLRGVAEPPVQRVDALGVSRFDPGRVLDALPPQVDLRPVRRPAGTHGPGAARRAAVVLRGPLGGAPVLGQAALLHARPGRPHRPPRQETRRDPLQDQVHRDAAAGFGALVQVLDDAGGARRRPHPHADAEHVRVRRVRQEHRGRGLQRQQPALRIRADEPQLRFDRRAPSSVHAVPAVQGAAARVLDDTGLAATDADVLCVIVKRWVGGWVDSER